MIGLRDSVWSRDLVNLAVLVSAVVLLAAEAQHDFPREQGAAHLLLEAVHRFAKTIHWEGGLHRVGLGYLSGEGYEAFNCLRVVGHLLQLLDNEVGGRVSCNVFNVFRRQTHVLKSIYW